MQFLTSTDTGQGTDSRSLTWIPHMVWPYLVRSTSRGTFAASDCLLGLSFKKPTEA